MQIFETKFLKKLFRGILLLGKSAKIQESGHKSCTHVISFVFVIIFNHAPIKITVTGEV